MLRKSIRTGFEDVNNKLAPMTSTVLEERETREKALVHKLRLQWMMTRDEAEKRRVGEEIRRRLLQPTEH